jgi:glycosyltransferase involved in cell wall biosynthesis
MVRVTLRIFMVAPPALLTDYRPHGDGLVAFGFISELAARGHKLHVAARCVDIERGFPQSVHIHRLGPEDGPSRLGRLDFMWRLRRLYRHLAETAPFDLVHQLNPVDAGLSLALADLPIPVVLGPYVPDWPGYRKPGGPLIRPLMLGLDGIIRAAQQRRATTVLLSTPAATTKLMVPSWRLRVRQVPPGIDDESWVPSAEWRDAKDVLFLANLEVRKGILVLLDAFPRLASELPDARLLIAGAGPVADDVRRRIRASSALERVELLGPVERAHGRSIMQACTLYCLPSYGEPFGMTALEAMACAKPVVATDAGGLRHLVPDEGGRKIPPGDALALADALHEVLVDPRLQRTMGDHNRRAVEDRYSWRRVVDRLEEVYREAIAEPHAVRARLRTRPARQARSWWRRGGANSRRRAPGRR